MKEEWEGAKGKGEEGRRKVEERGGERKGERRGGKIRIREEGGGKMYSLLRQTFVFFLSLPCDTPPDSSILLSDVHDNLDPFLQCAVLFFHSFTGISFVQPEDSKRESKLRK